MLNISLHPDTGPKKTLTELVGLVRNDLAQAVFILDVLLQDEKRENKRMQLNEVVNGLLLSNESLRLIARHFDNVPQASLEKTVLKKDSKEPA